MISFSSRTADPAAAADWPRDWRVVAAIGRGSDQEIVQVTSMMLVLASERG
jgi:hypothetical protein